MNTDKISIKDIPAKAVSQIEVARVLEKHDEGISPAGIAVETGRREEDVSNILSRMKKAGRAMQLEHGLWALGDGVMRPAHHVNPLLQTSPTDQVEKAETYSTAVTNINLRAILNSLISINDEPMLRQVVERRGEVELTVTELIREIDGKAHRVRLVAHITEEERSPDQQREAPPPKGDRA